MTKLSQEWLPTQRATADGNPSVNEGCRPSEARCLEAYRFGDELRARSTVPSLDLTEILHQLIGKLPVSGSAATRLNLSAVVVVTHRDDDEWRPGLVLAKHVAERWSVPLVLIRSGSAVTRAVSRHLAPEGPTGLVVIDLTDKGLHALAHFLRKLPSAGHEAMTVHREGTDTALKRNAATALGVLAGWETVLLLDDDILCVPPGEMAAIGLAGAAEQTEEGVLRIKDVLAEMASDQRMQAALYWAVDYADHSVTGRSRRDQRLATGAFAGGGVTLARVGQSAAFFPNIYNEDWFGNFGMIHSHPAQGPSPLLRSVGSVFQAPPSSAVTRERGRAEEIGDLTGEHLLSLFSTQPSDYAMEAATTPALWRNAIERRYRHLSDLIRATCPEHDPAHDVLRASLAVYDRWPREGLAVEVARWVRAWNEDLAIWPEFLDQIQSEASLDLDAAIHRMGLTPYTRRIPKGASRREWLARSA
jgi:hypothetical protein